MKSLTTVGLKEITTTEASQLTGIPASTICYWCECEYLTNTKTSDGHYRFLALDFEQHLHSDKAGKHRKNPKLVTLAELTFAPEYQLRKQVQPEVVDQYSAAIQAGEEIPPVTAVKHNDDLIVVDGWHRCFAYSAKEHTRVPCHILENLGEPELFFLALNANRRHGLPRSNADKRKAACAMVSRPEYATLSTRDLQALSGLSHNLIATVRREALAGEVKPKSPPKSDALPPEAIAQKIRALVRFLAPSHPVIAASIIADLERIKPSKS